MRSYCRKIPKMRTCLARTVKVPEEKATANRTCNDTYSRVGGRIDGKGKRMESVDAIFRRRSGTAAGLASIVLASLLSGAPATAKQQEPSVSIHSGTVVGQYFGHADDVAAFFGI